MEIDVRSQPRTSSYNLVTIYILLCNKDKYYVGKTTTPFALDSNDEILNSRILEHFIREGSEWTKRYPPLKILNIYPGSTSFDEDKYTKMYMAQYGIENVRGGSYCQIVLDAQTLDLLKKEIRGATNCCYQCGSQEHYIINCPNKVEKPYKRVFIVKQFEEKALKPKTLYRKSDSSKKYRDSENDQESDEEKITFCALCVRRHHVSECNARSDIYNNPITEKEKYFCKRCGHQSHRSNTCRARKDIYGNPF